MLSILRPVPDLRARVWGGRRLAPPGENGPIGEAWIAGPDCRVSIDDGQTATLDELGTRLGPALVGTAAPRPGRFPLLVKLIDPAEWLSVQVHPDDETALRLEGPGAVGKTEAWFVVEAPAGSRILVGPAEGVTEAEIRARIGDRGAGVAELLAVLAPEPGDSILVPAGTLHAIGPGLLLCEVQQPSDITYRVDDWGRPPSSARPLHTRQALEAWKPEARPVRRLAAAPGSSADAPAARRILASCPQFVLERAGVGAVFDPAGATPHVVLALPGLPARIAGEGWEAQLDPLEAVVIAAGAGPWRLTDATGAAGSPGASCLVARLPAGR